MGRRRRKKKRVQPADKDRWTPEQFRHKVVEMKNKPRRKADFKDRRFQDDGLFFSPESGIRTMIRRIYGQRITCGSGEV